LAATVIDVDKIEPDCRLFKPDLAWPGIADLHFLPAKLLGAAGLSDEDCVRHRSVSLLRPKDGRGDRQKKAPPRQCRAGLRLLIEGGG
jgi:hypothetical protein